VRILVVIAAAAFVRQNFTYAVSTPKSTPLKRDKFSLSTKVELPWGRDARSRTIKGYGAAISVNNAQNTIQDDRRVWRGRSEGEMA
jgi:hypothetical protein